MTYGTVQYLSYYLAWNLDCDKIHNVIINSFACWLFLETGAVIVTCTFSLCVAFSVFFKCTVDEIRLSLWSSIFWREMSLKCSRAFKEDALCTALIVGVGGFCTHAVCCLVEHQLLDDQRFSEKLLAHSKWKLKTWNKTYGSAVQQIALALVVLVRKNWAAAKKKVWLHQDLDQRQQLREFILSTNCKLYTDHFKIYFRPLGGVTLRFVKIRTKVRYWITPVECLVIYVK